MSIEDRERFAKIENALVTTTELQKQQRVDIDKILNGTKDLIAVSGVVLESIKELRAEDEAIRRQHEADYKEFRELSRETSEKLNILIDTVDRIIRKDGKGDK